MLCEKCKKNEANYYYRENVNGVEKEYHLCGECAKELEQNGEIKQFGMNFAKDNILNSFFGLDGINSVFGSLFAPASSASANGQNGLKNPEKRKCSLCGASFDELAREGKAGCPKCYDTFAAELEESIRRIHGRSSHTGHAPIKFREKNEAIKKLKELESQLKTEISNENYERAAELRDEIRALKNSNEGESAEE